MCYNDKLAFIKKIKLCLNCFSKGHVVKDCKSAFNCSKCQRRHNTLLCNTGTESGNQCITAPNTPVLQSTSEDTPQISSGVTIQSCAATTSRKVLLGTAIIHILHRGEIFKARAVFDSGSEASFISEHLFNLLRLNSKRISAQISGLNGCVSACSQKICDLCLSSPIDSGIFINASAIVLPRLTSSLPTFTADSDMFSRLPDIRLADPDFFRTSYIDILIGADLIPQVMLGGVRHKVCGTLMAQETVFGWILTGPVASDNISSFRTTVSYFNELALDERISKFFEMEDIPKRKHMSDDDKYCEEYFAESTRRGPTGRYVVSLPFKKEFGNTLRLGPSKRNVTAQYFRNENRLIRTPDLKVQYDKVLKEYLELGHMKEVPSNPSQDDSRYFLPHHAVVRPDSVTTKVRVVFNASNPTSNGVSLNDVLYCGPSLQLDLTSLLLQWRFYKIVFNSDIEKMYRQISVNPSHTPFQRIIFRDDPNDNLHEYELQTVTFGLNCAPYLALRTIQQLATDIKDVYPLASHVLMSCMYVDDVMAGGHDVSSAIKVQTELTAALESAGFALRKWTSNSSEFLASIPREHLLNEDFLQFNDNSTAKTLGVRWNARYDYFYFSAKAIRPNERPTKRFILSEISKLFDPAGWLCPYIVLAKLLMRDIWASNTDWDSPVPTHLLTNWLDFLANYSDINDLRISRWVQYTPDCEVQLHGFCDASEKAYAATIYSRTIDSNGNINTYLLVAKSRVSPLKTVSIPRLELCAALLLAETIEALMQVFPIPNTKIFCWSDSMIVLAWLKKPAFLWKTFIANRVSKISEIISGDNWSHVESRHNPADIASRGAYPKELSAFLASFHRFVSRRGCPRNLYSDNGTTFVGASKEISQNFLRCSRDSISANFSYQSITWHFIPPGAPHMGGLWEAGVKSFKLHFRKMAGNHKFTLEEFATILARIEACLNSRPISPVSEDPNDLLALTPGHFLTGGPILSIAEPSESDGNLSVLNRWRRVRALCQQFSIRWKHEYIKEIHKRMKWQTPQKNLEVGSMVVIRDDCLPPNEWRLGRVSKIYTGKDHLYAFDKM
ncbi:uncharacterized protein LOC131995958 [Stomoxys calcitrans]|uniref:uncharacterized protein LOC131995958 n=1 Tax=Stomoxys calcitrans TaxID=35570 RepID=UPI0027E36EC6|nr:uncharacterized protein LOC131995958 [Stomoxys calcitrans]